VVKVALWGGGNAARSLSFFYGKNGGEEEKKREKMDIKSKLCARAREILYILSLY